MSHENLKTGLVVNPPKPGDESYDLYVVERDSTLQSLSRRAEKLTKAFRAMEGVTCNQPQGRVFKFNTCKFITAHCAHYFQALCMYSHKFGFLKMLFKLLVRSERLLMPSIA